MEPIQRMGSCCTTQRLVAGVTFSLQSLGVSSFIDKGKGSPDQEFDYVCTKWCLKSWCSLLFLTNRCLLWHFFSQDTFTCIKNLFRQIFFLNGFLNDAWELVCCLLVGRSCFPWYLNSFFQLNLFLKLSDHSWLVLNSPALDPSPYFLH